MCDVALSPPVWPVRVCLTSSLLDCPGCSGVMLSACFRCSRRQGACACLANPSEFVTAGAGKTFVREVTLVSFVLLGTCCMRRHGRRAQAGSARVKRQQKQKRASGSQKLQDASDAEITRFWITKAACFHFGHSLMGGDHMHGEPRSSTRHKQ